MASIVARTANSVNASQTDMVAHSSSLASGHPLVMAISLAPTVSTAEIEQIQQTPGSPLALVREILLTEVERIQRTGIEEAPEYLALYKGGGGVQIWLRVLSQLTS